MQTCELCKLPTPPRDTPGAGRVVAWGIRVGDGYLKPATEYVLCSVCAHELSLTKKGERLPLLPPVEAQVANAYLSWRRDLEAWGRDVDGARVA